MKEQTERKRECLVFIWRFITMPSSYTTLEPHVGLETEDERADRQEERVEDEVLQTILLEGKTHS